MMKLRQKTRLIIILAAEFVAIAAILLMIFLAGKQTYKVTFDLNGGTLISGDLEQTVTRGQSANPPQATKDGCYFLRWSGSYREVTRNIEITAIWEYETTPGIEYTASGNYNYCEISGSFEGLLGDVYIGAYHNEKKVLGIKDNSFAERTGITSIYLLDGIITIGDGAFKNCTKLERIEIPSTVVSIGEGAFQGCESLKSVVLPKSLKLLSASAFEGCTSLESVEFSDSVEKIGDAAFAHCPMLTEIVLPESVVNIGSLAFTTQGLTVRTPVEEGETPEGWASDWCDVGVDVAWGYEEPIPEEGENGTEESEDSAA